MHLLEATESSRRRLSATAYSMLVRCPVRKVLLCSTAPSAYSLRGIRNNQWLALQQKILLASCLEKTVAHSSDMRMNDLRWRVLQRHSIHQIVDRQRCRYNRVDDWSQFYETKSWISEWNFSNHKENLSIRSRNSAYQQTQQTLAHHWRT